MRLLLPILLLVWIALAARAARAEEPNPAAPQPARLVLSVTSAPPSGLIPEQLRADLESELQAPVRLAPDEGARAGAEAVTIAYHALSNELTVRYQPAQGDAVTRTVSPHGGPETIAPLAVLLAGNVVRDQTSELLGPAPRPRAPVEPLSAAQPTHADLRAAPPPATAGAWRWSELRTTLRVRPVLWSGSLSLLNVGARFSTERAFAILSVSAHEERDRRMLGPGLAVGARMPWRVFALEGDVGVGYLRGLDGLFPSSTAINNNSPEVLYTNDRLITRLRTSLVFAPHPRVALFAGAALAMTTHLRGILDNEYGPELFAGVQL